MTGSTFAISDGELMHLVIVEKLCKELIKVRKLSMEKPLRRVIERGLSKVDKILKIEIEGSWPRFKSTSEEFLEEEKKKAVIKFNKAMEVRKA